MDRSPLLKKRGHGLITLIIIALLFSSVYIFMNPEAKKTIEVPLSTFIEQVKKGEVESLKVSDNKIEINLSNGAKEFTYKEPSQSISDILEDIPVTAKEKLKIVVKDTESSDFWMNLFISIVPFLLIVGFFLFMFRQAQMTNNQALGFGRSRAKIYEKGQKPTTFTDVAGCDEAKQELMEVVDFLKNPAKYQSLGAKIPKGVLLLGPPGCGKCVTGDTIVLTNKGLIPIHDIPKYFFVDNDNHVYGAKIIAFSEKDRKNHITEATHWYDLGDSPTIRIETQLGHVIEGTPEHPIIVLEKNGEFRFKPLAEIREQDYVVIKYNTQFFGEESRVEDEDTAYLIGLLIGDGGLTVKRRITFTTAEPKILQFVKQYFKERFQYDLIKMGGKYDWCIVKDHIVEKFFGEYGLQAVYSKQKSLPEWIRMAPKKIIQAFLRGLFDTDGTFDNKRGALQLSSASKKLIHETTLLLLNLGIVNRIFARRKLYNRELQYYLEISGDFLPAFQREINFRLALSKRARLENYLEHIKQNTNTNLVFFQEKFINDIWRVLKKRGIEVYNLFQGKRGLQYKNIIRYIKGNRQPSLQALREFMNKCRELMPNIVHNPAYQHIAGIVFSGFFFTPVTQTSVSCARVYDFTVPNYHSFIANGMISHNTMLARAVAGEANVPFFSIAGSEFVEMFVGVGASRVRDLFHKAKRNAPCIIFIDELDAVGRHRGAGLGGGHDEREQTLNQILTEMDGFEQDTKVIVISATNRPDVLDPALLRPGRFDRRVVVDQPDLKDRVAILKVHSKGKPLARDADLTKIAKQTPGFVGADLENLMNEAAILAARRNKKRVGQREIEQSIEKVLMGPERKSKVLSEQEREITAYHEAGHALVAQVLPECDPVHKVSIISRGMALGITWFMPEEEKHLYSKNKFESELASLLGGYTAEELTFGPQFITTGASNDLEKATEIARKMVTAYGMSSLGPVIYGDHNREIFLGKDFGHVRNYSEEIAAKIDEEIRTIIQRAYEKARETILKYKDKLGEIAKVLLEKETITAEEFFAFFPGMKKKEPVFISKESKNT